MGESDEPEGVASLLLMPPGAGTAAVLEGLDPGSLTQAARVDVLVAVDRLISWASAVQVRLLAAMAADPCSASVAPKLDREWVSEDVRLALGDSGRGAQHRVKVATELVERLPDTLAALGEGRISGRQAVAVAEAVFPLADEVAVKIEKDVLPVRERPTDPVPNMAAFRRKLRRAGLRHDPRSAAEKADRAAEDRDVWLVPQENSVSYVNALLPADGAALVMAAVEAEAAEQADPADARTRAQRRADALVQICADRLSGTPAGGVSDGVKIKMDRGVRHGLRPSIQVSVALSTLLGLDEQPGELDGYGDIPAELARALAADPTGTWRRLVTDDLGRLVDYGRTTYKPPAALARHVMARHRTCCAPGCNRPAVKSDLHHVRPWSQGGETNADNLVPLCERHHYAVHDGAWKIKMDTDGSVAWTSPNGRTYREPAASYPIDGTIPEEPASTEQPDQDAA